MKSNDPQRLFWTVLFLLALAGMFVLASQPQPALP